jgi:hypothetical protein
MLNQESQMMHSSMLMSTIEKRMTAEPDNSAERSETRRRADEALQRANQWVEWMETKEEQTSPRTYRSCMNPATSPSGMTGGRSIR